jgi:hypothetical protein
MIIHKLIPTYYEHGCITGRAVFEDLGQLKKRKDGSGRELWRVLENYNFSRHYYL